MGNQLLTGAVLGAVQTGRSIYADFTSGHPGRALGAIGAYAGLFALTRGAGAAADEATGAAAADTGSAFTGALSRFPKAAQLSEKPPGFNPETWQWQSATRTNVGKDWWDPEGGEWRYHPADKYHDPHWDYNPWTQWNSPWQHLYPGE